MLFHTNFNFLNFFLGNFLTATNLNHSLIIGFTLTLGLMTILYFFYDLSKRLFDVNHTKFLLLVRDPEKNFEGDLNFDFLDYPYGSEEERPKNENHKSQIMVRNLLKVKVQLFENSYFNYLTGYFMDPMNQFEIQVPQKTMLFEVIQDVSTKEIYASKALKSLMFSNEHRGRIFNDDLKKGIYQKINSSDLTAGEEVLKILKEETMDLEIKLKPKEWKLEESVFRLKNPRMNFKFRISEGKIAALGLDGDKKLNRNQLASVMGHYEKKRIRVEAKEIQEFKVNKVKDQFKLEEVEKNILRPLTQDPSDQWKDWVDIVTEYKDQEPGQIFTSLELEEDFIVGSG